MASQAERAKSFGSVASEYDRLRPTASSAALDWLVPADCEVAVEVGAGTGLFTEPLAARVPRVIAVEPDPEMRAVLAAKDLGVEVLDGTGEAIPLPDASADALYVASAWHWLDAERAIPEIARVLRDRGRIGITWTGRDRHIDWVADLDRLPGESTWDSAAEERRQRRREYNPVEGGPFDDVDFEAFAFERRMTVDDVVAMSATYSGVITASPQDRAAVLDRARSILAERFPGADEVEIPMRTWCWRATRLSR